MNPWLMLAQLGMSGLNYNKEIQHAADAAKRDEIAARGGKYSRIAPQGYEMPNLWADLAAGATSGMQMSQAQNQNEQNDALIKMLTQRQNQGSLNYSMPSSSSFGQGMPSMLGAW